MRALGLLGAVELVSDRGTKASFDASLGVARRVWLATLEQGVIVRPLPGDVVAMSPPLVIREAELDHVVDVLDRAIERVAAEL